MTRGPDVERLDPSDPRARAAVEAERKLFAYYGLEYKTRYIDVDEYGIRVRVLDVGSGPPLLMVPGGNGESAPFVPMMAKLRGRRFIVVNRPGGGMSDGVDSRQVDLRHLAVSTLTAVLDAFEIDSADVFASSMGGLWTLWLALDRPERVASMVQAGCPALILGSSAPPPMRALSIPGINRILFRVFRPGSGDNVRKMLGMVGCSSETIAALPDELPETLYRMFDLPTYRTSWLSLMQSALWVGGSRRKYQLGVDDLSKVRQPTLFIWGDKDRFGRVELGRIATEAMPNATLNETSGSHLLIIDDPAGCATLVHDFLAQQSPGPDRSLVTRRSRDFEPAEKTHLAADSA